MVAHKARRKQKELEPIDWTSCDLPIDSAYPPDDGLPPTQVRIMDPATCSATLGFTVADVLPWRSSGKMAQVPSAMPTVRATRSIAGRGKGPYSSCKASAGQYQNYSPHAAPKCGGLYHAQSLRVRARPRIFAR